MDPLQAAAQELTRRRPEAALQIVEQALRERPGFPPLVSLAAVALADLGRFEEALDRARTASAAAPSWPDGLINLGYVQEAAGTLEQAERSLRLALEARPGHPTAATNLANLLLKGRRPQEALTALDDALTIAPAPSLLLRKADALKALDREEEALALYRRLAEDASGNTEAANKAAAILLEHGRPAEALTLLDDALARTPDRPQLHNNRGTALRLLKRSDDAVEAYRRSTALAPGRAEAWRNLGLLAVERERDDEAREAFRHVLELAPTDVTARHMLDALEGRTTKAPPEGFIARSFDVFAPTFENRLVEELAYRVPWDMAELLVKAAPGQVFARGLDLGCGTGLVADVLDRALAEGGGAPVEHWTGVDLSARMLQKAAAKGRYAALEQAEILAFLETASTGYDLVTAADVLIYLGEVAPLMAGIARVLAPGGIALLSTERLEEGTVALRASGRYAQGDGHMAETIAAAGLRMLAAEPIELRLEYGRPIAGTLFCGRKADG